MLWSRASVHINDKYKKIKNNKKQNKKSGTQVGIESS